MQCTICLMEGNRKHFGEIGDLHSFVKIHFFLLLTDFSPLNQNFQNFRNNKKLILTSFNDDSVYCPVSEGSVDCVYSEHSPDCVYSEDSVDCVYSLQLKL